MQIREHLKYNILFSKYQSAYRKFFSTESALVKLTNDLRLNLDRTKALFILDLISQLPLTLSIMNYFFRFLEQVWISNVKCLGY